MKISSPRFDGVEIDERDVITLDRGLIGLPELRRFVVMDFDETSSFHWLQSLDRPEIGFVVADPVLFSESYTVTIDTAAPGMPAMAEGDELVVMVIVTVQNGGASVTANLLGPVVVNAATRLGCQVVLDPERYATRAPLRNAGARVPEPVAAGDER